MIYYNKSELINYLTSLKITTTYKKECGIKIAYNEVVAS